MKSLRFLLFFVLLIFIVWEGISLGFVMMNQPDDLTVFAGIVIAIISASLFWLLPRYLIKKGWL